MSDQVSSAEVFDDDEVTGASGWTIGGVALVMLAAITWWLARRRHTQF